MIVHSKLNLQPQGAYVDLQALQQLRYAAESMASSTQPARSAIGSGQHRSHALNRGMEFEEVRVYQPGDDVRTIDWRVTARTQLTHTKRYRDEKERPVITLVDQRRSLFFGSRHCFKSVYACHLAALINWSTLKRGDRAGGLVVGANGIHEMRPKRSHKTVNQWLQLLAHSNHAIDIENQQTEPGFAESLQQLARIARSGTDCILITDCYDWDASIEKHLHRLCQHNQVTLYWLVDPLEKQLPPTEAVTIGNGKERYSLTIGEHQQQIHAQHFAQKEQYLRELCQRYRIHLVTVNVDTALTETGQYQARAQ